MPSPQRIQWARFRVAAVSFVALLILAVLVVLLSRGSLFRSWEYLHIYAPDAVGVARNSPVRLNGIPIGKVSGVRFSGLRDPGRVIVIDVQMEAEFLSQIPRDSVVALSSENIIGEQFVDISKGRDPNAVGPGGTLRFEAAPPVLKALDLRQFQANLRTIDALLADIQQGKTRVGEFFLGDQLYRDTITRVAELEKAIDEAVGPQGTAGRLIYGEEAYRRVIDPIRRLDEQLAGLQRGEGAGRYLRDAAPHDQLVTQVADIRRAVARVRDLPFVRDDTLYEGWRRQVAGLVLRVDQFNAGGGPVARLSVDQQPYESLSGAVGQWRDALRDFRSDPRKYLRLSIF